MNGARWLTAALALATLVLTAGCASNPGTAPRQDPRDKDLGKTITVVGTARDAKLGALVECKGGPFWLDGVDRWSDDASGKRVNVTGTLVKRQDLPVFVEKENEPPRQGIPVPPGTDLSKAGTRYLIEKPAWKLAVDQSGAAVPPTATEGLSQDPNGNFVLYVSNQSFAISPVDIVILIDGRKAIQEDFVVADQHVWKKYVYRLDDGTHKLSATSKKGGTALNREFVVKGKRWAALNFWYYPESHPDPTPRHFSLDIKDQPIYFN